ncbi:hypothetical protein LINPERHAP1_LOCUS34987 [Linum perenne]
MNLYIVRYYTLTLIILIFLIVKT